MPFLVAVAAPSPAFATATETSALGHGTSPTVAAKWSTESPQGSSAAKDAANRARLAADLERTPANANARKVADALSFVERDDLRDGSGRRVDAFLLIYEPDAFGGKGTAAVSYGNPDFADVTGLVLAGLETSVKTFENVSGNASRLYKETVGADWSKTVAIVAWQGYDAPHFGNVLRENAAQNGSRFLVDDIAALKASHVGATGRTGHLPGHNVTPTPHATSGLERR